MNAKCNMQLCQFAYNLGTLAVMSKFKALSKLKTEAYELLNLCYWPGLLHFCKAVKTMPIVDKILDSVS